MPTKKTIGRFAGCCVPFVDVAALRVHHFSAEAMPTAADESGFLYIGTGDVRGNLSGHILLAKKKFFEVYFTSIPRRSFVASVASSA